MRVLPLVFFLGLSDSIFPDLRYLAVTVLGLVLVFVLVQSEGPRVPHCSMELVGIFPRSVVVLIVIGLNGAGIVAP